MSATDAAGWQSKVIMKRNFVLLDGERGAYGVAFPTAMGRTRP